jgi:hypothetical protein
MRRRKETNRIRPRKALGRAVVCSVALALAATASAAAAAFTGATVPSQTDTVTTHGVAPVKVSCPSSARGSCTGKLTLKTASKVKQGSTSRVLTLGSRNFTIAAGKSSRVNVKLSSDGMKLLNKDHTIKPNATATSRDGSNKHVTRTTKITLKKKGSGNTSPAPQCGLYACST